ncbi:ribonuclease G [Paenibacillus shirakamiensis]|uniref:Ribonuclease G n=1 Tax=Paenibacillus shirakamiensis TaxID=1265935 RepID=A0ABS4JH71_9BACL|nr:Rne/Rng family ribonuclease [Paenibacillus shirakamiensis]MBP2000395.1 ribonuclease G [Paenibacillus shirakamiensis]
MKQMIIHCEPSSTQMALMEAGRLVEFAVERTQAKGLVGSFFKGKVVNVIPGMQAAFVDIGQKKNAFLYIDDVLHPHLDKQPKVKPSIIDLLKVGQEIIVQVTKDAIGTKGARVTTHYSLPGRWIVYMPISAYVAVSKRVEREAERIRLRQIGEQLRNEQEGLILRTVAEDEPPEAIQDDFRMLRKQWTDIQILAKSEQAPAVLHRELSMVQRLFRDAYTAATAEIVMDDEEQAREAGIFLQDMLPVSTPRIHTYRGERPIFEVYGIQQQINKDFQRKIWLPGGGYLIWDSTEALTVIDVNTGKFTGSVNLEDTVVQTNVEAAFDIARLLRLRDTGGIVIIDFIDMELESNRIRVSEMLEVSMRPDRTQHHIMGWTKLGLLELTRKKMRESTAQSAEVCNVCQGTGWLTPVTKRN